MKVDSVRILVTEAVLRAHARTHVKHLDLRKAHLRTRRSPVRVDAKYPKRMGVVPVPKLWLILSPARYARQ
jgi:hypothetical protein